jgi:hypothetical protein
MVSLHGNVKIVNNYETNFFNTLINAHLRCINVGTGQKS